MPLLLRAADGRVDGPEAQRTRQCSGVGCDVGSAVVAQELQWMACRHRFHVAEAAFSGFDEHFAHRLARQSFALQALQVVTSRSQQSFVKVGNSAIS